jgi:hypothetical protein
MLKISTFCPNRTDDRFISGLILKIEGLKIQCLKIDAPLKDVTTRFNENREIQVSKRTVQRSLYQEGHHRRVVKKKVRIREVNRKKLVKWVRENLHRSVSLVQQTITSCVRLVSH